MSKELNIPVAEIGAMPYQKFLFWQNYLRIKQQRSTINNGQS
jgi:hypothetical protein